MKNAQKQMYRDKNTVTKRAFMSRAVLATAIATEAHALRHTVRRAAWTAPSITCGSFSWRALPV